MIGNSYKVSRDNTIDIANNYIEQKGNVNDGVDLNFLKQRVKALETGKFLLSVQVKLKQVNRHLSMLYSEKKFYLQMFYKPLVQSLKYLNQKLLI